jgi:hypothetical protein
VNNYTGALRAHQYASVNFPVLMPLATDGLNFVSMRYAEQARRAHEAGLMVWHYHFCRPESNPLENGEAAHFWRTVRPYWRHGDRLVIDLERMHPQGPQGLVEYLATFDSRLHHISGIAATCYIPDSLFRQCGPRLQVISGDFHIASWGGNVARLGAGRRMIAQQITGGKPGESPVHLPGISGVVDVNRIQRWYARKLLSGRAAGQLLRK